MDARSRLRRLPSWFAAPCTRPGTTAGALPWTAVAAAAVAVVLAAPALGRDPRPLDGPATSRSDPRATTTSEPRATPAEPRPHGKDKHRADRHHRKQIGTASVYARRFGGRKMADGTRLDLRDHVAASRTLPLGTEARVTNLETGLSTRVTIQDRGPYAKGRILDLTPAAADSIGLTPKEGVAKVEVQPLVVPPPKD